MTKSYFAFINQPSREAGHMACQTQKSQEAAAEKFATPAALCKENVLFTVMPGGEGGVEAGEKPITTIHKSRHLDAQSSPLYFYYDSL